MSPRPADPTVREALIDRAAHLLADRQPVTLRGLAAEVGTSTMAIYTHFGSMDELLREVRREGFNRLAAHLAEVPATKDPVGDLVALGWAYCLNAVANPDMYRVMFVETSSDMEEAAFGAATFLPVLSNVERCIQAGRMNALSAWDVSVEMWAMTHGMVTLALGGMLTVAELLEHLHNAIRAFLIGYGDDAAKADKSVRTVRRRMEATTTIPKLPDRGATLSVATQKAARDRHR